MRPDHIMMCSSTLLHCRTVPVAQGVACRPLEVMHLFGCSLPCVGWGSFSHIWLCCQHSTGYIGPVRVVWVLF
jgi:hypothetical protein